MSMHSSFSNLWLKDAVHLTYSIEGTLSQICPPFFGVPAPLHYMHGHVPVLYPCNTHNDMFVYQQ